MSSENPTISRLEDQINWYDQKSDYNKRWFKGIKLIEILSAAIIPFSAGSGASAYLTGGLGILIVILESLQHLNQYHHNWITYRSTCEELKHEKYLYLAKAGPYANLTSPEVLLAERIEGLISQEHAKWVSSTQQSVKTKTANP